MAEDYLDQLSKRGSPLTMAGDAVLDQLREQFLSVLDEAAGVVHDSDRPISTTIGRDRAANGIHPSESLAAAHVIFVAALPDLSKHFAAEGHSNPTEMAATRLSEVILRRMAVAAKAYVEYLLEKAATAHADEARRLSRELHDAVGPTVAVGLQNLDLIAHYLESDPTKVGEKIQAGREAMLEAITLVRNLSAETRLSVAPEELALTLNGYLSTLGAGIRVGLNHDVDLSRVPAHYAREIFLIVREAVRNAVKHGAPSEVTIDLLVVGPTFTGVVTDDGVGFDTTVPTQSGTGLASMHERAALIGGTINIESEPSQTRVVLSVPLPIGD
ncbi:sensor histidine kinase [Nocardioides baekrokdamisoli]|nr:ATP-binding protein [Nocardioides baekrokdamisoli]